MTARILVVDDVPANVKLLEARLMAEYFEVLTAADGYEALAICDKVSVDIVLLDVMMPGIDGFEVCERLKANSRTAHIPVVMITALDQPSDRVRGLQAGADDFLTKPVNDLQLLSRVKSLARLKAVSDELRLRAETARSVGLYDLERYERPDEPGSILLVDARASSQERLSRALRPIGEIIAMSDPQAALFEAAERSFDLIIVNANFEDYDPLRLCSQLRSLERTRYIPVLLIVEQGSEDLVVRALDLGVSDYLMRPVDPNELLARSLSQIRRKHCNDRLRASLRETIELAVIDGLTGLHNRRYLDTHLRNLMARAIERGQPLALCITDIDRFKSVNDVYGHDVGDDVIREFARRIRSAVRGADLACRYGGEEFVLVLPDTTMPAAVQIAERLRRAVEDVPVTIGREGISLPITASMGLAVLHGPDDTPEAMLKRADTALYEAKNRGRNQVVSEAA
ncbi:PleD family two-component system response regulator [Xaviernesmea oryzae]|uniref:diguanylate cyclase n=1 Tax=Xaviernesmea oryzae TaxID=464029 RepID=A0A1Q9ASQ2_9HYPH|nr:PleD family two-component system response regulator [Xaviernesmea oryzae]OLP58460.1 PleD family two-component system response regulator [Xaviernesmea oryzae]SEM22469.1 two-component system, cell cycle response regulator [Xaviernesmea oryzae]